MRRGSEALAFYTAAFSEELHTIEDPGGAVLAQLAVDGAQFWIGDESPEHGNFSPGTLKGGTVP